ncbi:hypothetical protein DENIS_1011 [Desulfonema ishimotonii]|uniref:3-deoxy-D-manno-octulosonic acid transferase n=1 Tax=Desulfonema ishimotonii TaxID=45657 RepID=A0A401FSX3_9BACT|nr:hypothetical protein DENIS_1011 [Desulfonema ishimotonii]
MSHPFSLSPPEHAALALYDLVWRMATPLLRRNARLSEGFEQRTLQQRLPAADLWIQAASAGESYLVSEILKTLRPPYPIRVLMTSNTRQGVEILQRVATENASRDRYAGVAVAYFPFDRPGLMKKAVEQVRPRLMVLAETEIWPGLLTALRRFGSRTVLVNGRMSPGSLRGYSLWPALLRKLGPDRVLAVSPDDAGRFGQLFGRERVSVMSNIKFDRIRPGEAASDRYRALKRLLPDAPFLVLGSVRHDEAGPVEKMLCRIRQACPQAVTGLFPRHLHRTAYWKARLDAHGIPWVLRSHLSKPVTAGSVILWDTFGELASVYRLAGAAFVGGSLGTFGCQNFLEPLTCGLMPVIGPCRNHFEWVGTEIFDRGLVRMGEDWQAVSALLTADLENPRPRRAVLAAVKKYLSARQGGTVRACELIEGALCK